MSIIAWREAKEHATLTATLGGRRVWSAPYILTSDNPRDDAKTCVDFMDTIGRGLRATFRYGDREDAFSWCKEVSPSRIPGSAHHWAVTCSYSPAEEQPPQERPDEDGQPTDNPMDWRYEISSGTQFYQVPVWKAWNVDAMPVGGTGAGYKRGANTLGPVHNSAGVVYDPPLMREVPETVIRISGNLLEFWAAILQVNAGTINPFALSWSNRMKESYGFHEQSFQPHCVLCSSVTTDYRSENGIRYWRYTFEFRLRTPADSVNPQDGFLETLLDRGFTRLANVDAPDLTGDVYYAGDFKEGMAQGEAVRGVDGQRVPEMMLLNGHGQPLTASDTFTAPPVYFRWRIHPYAEFKGLPLDIFA